jgi:hypothetical protein
VLDVADTTAWGDTDLNVTLVTPWGAPGVLDKVEFIAILSAIAYSEDSVVNIGTATRHKNTSTVVLEGTAVSSNRNSDGLLSNSSLELRRTVVRDIFEAWYTNLTLGWVVFASLISTSVFVVRFKLNLGFLSVLESVILETTVAATVILVAVNELLLRERKKFTRGDLMSSFHGTRGGERPAGTTASLIFDGCYGTLWLPVNSHWVIILR